MSDHGMRASYLTFYERAIQTDGDENKPRGWHGTSIYRAK